MGLVDPNELLLPLWIRPQSLNGPEAQRLAGLFQFDRISLPDQLPRWLLARAFPGRGRHRRDQEQPGQDPDATTFHGQAPLQEPLGARAIATNAQHLIPRGR
jgi:hypothetical protein